MGGGLKNENSRPLNQIQPNFVDYQYNVVHTSNGKIINPLLGLVMFERWSELGEEEKVQTGLLLVYSNPLPSQLILPRGTHLRSSSTPPTLYMPPELSPLLL